MSDGRMNIDAKLGLDVFKLDKEPHIVIDHEICRAVCKKKVCLTVCPADLYELNDEGDVVVNWRVVWSAAAASSVVTTARWRGTIRAASPACSTG